MRCPPPAARRPPPGCREAHYIAESVAATSMLGSLDMVEVNPSLGSGGNADDTAELALAISASALGSRLL